MDLVKDTLLKDRGKENKEKNLNPVGFKPTTFQLRGVVLLEEPFPQYYNPCQNLDLHRLTIQL